MCVLCSLVNAEIKVNIYSTDILVLVTYIQITTVDKNNPIPSH